MCPVTALSTDFDSYKCLQKRMPTPPLICGGDYVKANYNKKKKKKENKTKTLEPIRQPIIFGVRPSVLHFACVDELLGELRRLDCK